MKSLFEPVMHLAEEVQIPAGTTLFQEGDSSDYAYLIKSGKCLLSQNAKPVGTAQKTAILNLGVVLGSLPYTTRAICQTDCVFYKWDMSQLWHNEIFSRKARQHLVQQIDFSLKREEQFIAPIHYQGNSAQLNAGAFEFPSSQIIFAFCHAELSSLQLPDGVSRMGNSLLIAFASFPNGRYANAPEKTFNYGETTFFVPVRVGATLGLYVPYIYPSSYEAILLGREIYGFPKRLGHTWWEMHDQLAALRVDDEILLKLGWGDYGTSSSEAQLVGAMGGLFGVQGKLTSAAFRVGDTLLNLMNVPFYRRISVFNHKLIPDITTKYDEPVYAVNQLTQAIFQVERWHNIEKLSNPQITEVGRMFQNWHIQVREAYQTKLDMRLSTGRLVRDYRVE